MTEPIRALVYHQPTLGRRPLFVALAILAVAFGALGAIMAVTNSISYLSLLARQAGASAANLRYSVVPSVVGEILRTPAYICLAIAGIGFLIKARWTTTLLCIYLGISLVAVFASLVASSLVAAPMGMPVAAMSSIGRFIPAIARATFDVMTLLLLLNRSVRGLIQQASGLEDPSLPDFIRAE
jgi:hypothetical protein